mmetsp:Transcript_66249/g.184771  ORF Transcript_66249/g.184771 Transcript_66249/m.184771 type:complete len:658 (+) Transcript_66249:1143-3116(+)
MQDNVVPLEYPARLPARHQRALSPALVDLAFDDRRLAVRVPPHDVEGRGRAHVQPHHLGARGAPHEGDELVPQPLEAAQLPEPVRHHALEPGRARRPGVAVGPRGAAGRAARLQPRGQRVQVGLQDLLARGAGLARAWVLPPPLEYERLPVQHSPAPVAHAPRSAIGLGEDGAGCLVDEISNLDEAVVWLLHLLHLSRLELLLVQGVRDLELAVGQHGEVGLLHKPVQARRALVVSQPGVPERVEFQLPAHGLRHDAVHSWRPRRGHVEVHPDLAVGFTYAPHHRVHQVLHHGALELAAAALAGALGPALHLQGPSGDDHPPPLEQPARGAVGLGVDLPGRLLQPEGVHAWLVVRRHAPHGEQVAGLLLEPRAVAACSDPASPQAVEVGQVVQRARHDLPERGGRRRPDVGVDLDALQVLARPTPAQRLLEAGPSLRGDQGAAASLPWHLAPPLEPQRPPVQHRTVPLHQVARRAVLRRGNSATLLLDHKPGDELVVLATTFALALFLEHLSIQHLRHGELPLGLDLQHGVFEGPQLERFPQQVQQLVPEPVVRGQGVQRICQHRLLAGAAGRIDFVAHQHAARLHEQAGVRRVRLAPSQGRLFWVVVQHVRLLIAEQLHQACRRGARQPGRHDTPQDAAENLVVRLRVGVAPLGAS